MRVMNRHIRLLLTLAGVTSLLAHSCLAEGVSFEQKLGAQVPLRAEFRNEAGLNVRLGGYFSNHRPVILAPVYFGCPGLCDTMLEGLGQTLAKLHGQNAGYRLLVVSINPEERSPLALSKKRSTLARAGLTEHSAEASQWSFLTGSQASIEQLSQSIGFQYHYDSLSRTYQHPSGLVVLTPSGKVSKYFFGTRFEPQAVETYLQTAGKERRSSLVEQILVLCSHYDPSSSRMGHEILLVLRVAAGATTLLIFVLLLRLHRREVRP